MKKLYAVILVACQAPQVTHSNAALETKPLSDAAGIDLDDWEQRFAGRRVVPKIDSQLGERLSLCGRADKALTQARLAADAPHPSAPGAQAAVDERFEIANPDIGSTPYWGIRFDEDAYVCVNFYSTHRAMWEDADGNYTPGYFSELTITLQGFKLNAAGARIDLNQDGAVDDSDWTRLRILNATYRNSPGDGAALFNGYFGTSVLDGATDAAATGIFDFEGGYFYLNGDDPSVATIQLSSNQLGNYNLRQCFGNSPLAYAHECLVYDNSFAGVALEVTREPNSVTLSQRFEHKNTIWLRYHANDSTAYVINDAYVSGLLAQIGFEPTFWSIQPAIELDYLPL